jgi:hypothetical protein
MPGGELFAHFFLMCGAKKDIDAYRDYCEQSPTAALWHVFSDTPAWIAFADTIRRNYFARFLAHITLAVRGVSQKSNRLSTVWGQVFTHLGCSNVGLDVNHTLGMTYASRRMRENTTYVTMAYDAKVALMYQEDRVFASWVDNYAHHYYAAVMRVNRGYMHKHDGHVRGLLVGRVRDMALPRRVDNTIVPAFDHAWFSLPNRLAVAAQVAKDLHGGQSMLWTGYYATSLCRTDAIGTCPPRPPSYYTVEHSTFHAEGMYPERVSTTAGYIAALASLAAVHATVWNRGRATLAVVDVDLYMRYNQYLTSEVGLQRLGTHACFFFGAWHTAKILCNTVFERHFLTIIGPALRFMYPNTNLYANMSYQVQMQVMCDIACAYEQDHVRWRDIEHEYRDTDRGKHVTQFLRFFCPLVSFYKRVMPASLFL